MSIAKKPLPPLFTASKPTRADGVARGDAVTHTLPIGTRLRDYEISEIINEAGFGVVYLAYDHSLQRQVAIKEFLPVTMVTRAARTLFVSVRPDQNAGTYRAGLKSFMNEARLLARFDHPSLVKVYRFWEENGTAYMVMPYYQGPDLKSALADLGRVPTEPELRNWLRPILDAVTVMHQAGFYHHHIGIDNIRLTELGPVLLDFAAARRVVEGETHNLATSLKPGFAAIEQYGDGPPGTQGAWTDLYALGAVLYTAITGTPPMPAPERLARDGVLKLRDAAAMLYSDAFLQAIDAALSVQPEARPRDHAQFRALMRDIDAPNETVALSALRDLMLEPFVLDPTRAPGETTVPNGTIAEATEPRRTRPGALRDVPPTTSPGALSDSGHPSQPGALRGGRNSRPGALNSSAAANSRPGALQDARNSRPGNLAASGSKSRPGTLDSTPAALHSSASRSAPAHVKPAKLAFSPRAARLASEDEHTGAPSDLNSEVDFSGALEAKTFFDRFGVAAKAGIAIVALGVIGISIWLAKPSADGTDQVETPVPVLPSTTVTPPATVPINGPAVTTPPAPPTATDAGAPVSAASRQARCVEILQKVSLEPMTPADAAFYKKECQR